MDLKAYLEKFESEAKGEIHSFIDFVHAEERKLLAPFHSDEPVIPMPSTDDGNPPVAVPVAQEEPIEETPVDAPAEETPEEAPATEEVPAETAPVEDTPTTDNPIAQ